MGSIPPGSYSPGFCHCMLADAGKLSLQLVDREGLYSDGDSDREGKNLNQSLGVSHFYFSEWDLMMGFD